MGPRIVGLYRREPRPMPVPVAQRLRSLPKAMLLTAGYYASRMPVINGILRRPM